MDRLNRRFPGEWEPQIRTWLSWPHHEENWGERPEIVDFYIELIRMIRQFQKVGLLVPSSHLKQLPTSLQADAAFPLEIFPIPTNDIWIRDYGPIFVIEKDALRAVSFEFNAWGNKFPPFDLDNQVPDAIASTLKMSLSRHLTIFEGGAIETNGAGLGITTYTCVAGRNRQPPDQLAISLENIENALGFRELLVLPEGLCGDHTDGHIDNVARFLSPNHVVMAREDDSSSLNHRILADVFSTLEKWRPSHQPIQISTLPLPPQRKIGNETLPASYMNFIFVNGGVIVPLYQCSHDATALEFFKKVYPDRTVLGIDCTLVIEEGGSLHCLSKQEPLLSSVI